MAKPKKSKGPNTAQGKGVARPGKVGASRPGASGLGQRAPGAVTPDWGPLVVPYHNAYQAAHAPQPAPAPPPPPQPDAAYQNRIDFAGREYTRQTGDLDKSERELKFDYGIEDPTNPFSRMAGLKRMYLARTKGTSNTLAASGMQYSGAHQRKLQNVRYDQEKDTAAMRQEYQKAKDAIAKARADAAAGKEAEGISAYEDWLGRAGGY